MATTMAMPVCEPGSDGSEDEEPTETEVWFEEALNAYAQNPNDEAILGKKSFYEARRALDKSWVSRGFYPETKGKSKGKGKTDGKTSEFRGRCMRCGKWGHNVQVIAHSPAKDDQRARVLELAMCSPTGPFQRTRRPRFRRTRTPRFRRTRTPRFPRTGPPRFSLRGAT